MAETTQKLEDTGEVNNLNILADIDALMDTRETLLAIISPRIYKKVMESKEYFKRTNNTFDTLAHKNFEYYFMRRETELLRRTRYPTRLVEVIESITVQILANPIRFMKTDSIKLFVIVDPYRPNKDELPYLAKLINIFYSSVEVILVTKERLLDLKWIQKEIGFMFLYRGSKWIQARVQDFKLVDHPLIQTTLYLPFILERVQHVPFEKQKEVLKELHVTAASLISLDFLKLEMFSLHPEHYIKES